MSKTVLKPCPFCGGEAQFTHLPSGCLGRYGVSCSTGGCQAAMFSRDTKEEAAEKWNRRVGDGT